MNSAVSMELMSKGPYFSFPVGDTETVTFLAFPPHAGEHEFVVAPVEHGQLPSGQPGEHLQVGLDGLGPPCVCMLHKPRDLGGHLLHDCEVRVRLEFQERDDRFFLSLPDDELLPTSTALSALGNHLLS